MSRAVAGAVNLGRALRNSGVPLDPGWPDNPATRAAVKSEAARIVARLAPDEIDLFDELAAEFFADPRPPGKPSLRDDPCGFGADDFVVATTPAVLAVVVVTFGFALARLARTTGDLASALTFARASLDEKRCNDLVQELSERIRASARRFGLDEKSREQLLALCLESLTSSATQDAPPPPTRVLAVFASPRGASALRLGEEDRALRACLAQARHGDRVRLRVCHAVTIDDLRRALLEESCDILHYSGHGNRQGIVFETESGRPFVPPMQAIAELLADYTPPMRCVLLNACESDGQSERLTALGLPYTIGMRAPISDCGSIAFTRGFYDAIASGLPVDRAYREGCHSLALAGLDEHHVPALRTRESKDRIDAAH